MTKELLIIIPAYNEEKNIHKVLGQLEQPEIASIADVLVIDDASQDDTGRIVSARGHRLVRHVFNLGYGSALQLGYQYAERKGYRYVIQMDADGQHDAWDIPVIYEKLKEKNEQGESPDIVLASRFMEQSSHFSFSLMKKLACVMFRALIWLTTGKQIADPTTGYQGLSRSAFCYYAGYGHFDDKYPDANMVLQMMLLGYSIAQIPAQMHARTEGKSMHSGLKPVWYMLRMCFSMLSILFRVKILKLERGSCHENKARGQEKISQS